MSLFGDDIDADEGVFVRGRHAALPPHDGTVRRNTHPVAPPHPTHRPSPDLVCPAAGLACAALLRTDGTGPAAEELFGAGKKKK